jgi:diguanylate cyclase (GGDEF)-like protein
LYDMTVRDALTGLHNRRYLEDRLRAEGAFARRHGSFLSALILDLDHFKEVNDTHGHLVGDRVLSETAGALRRTVRTEDVLARWGGEEFVLLVRAIPPAGVALLGERLRRAVEDQTVRFEDLTIRITASVGTCTDRGRAKWEPRDLLTAADRALYRAKTDGRNRVCAGSPGPDDAGGEAGREERAE